MENRDGRKEQKETYPLSPNSVARIQEEEPKRRNKGRSNQTPRRTSAAQHLCGAAGPAGHHRLTCPPAAREPG